MKPTARRYYAELKADYAAKIRQLVPGYDEMVECIIALLELRAPQTLLDIGAGTGNVSVQILERIPGVRVAAVEPSAEMQAEAQARLQPYGDRVELINADVRSFRPSRRYDAVLSNLVLHNLPPADKQQLLRSCQTWLEPRGCFIWGDLVRHADPQTQAFFVEQRKTFARDRGCPEALVRWNFEKESRDDHPLTAEETIAAAVNAGFSCIDLVWARDTFAIFLLTAQAPLR